MKFYRDGKLRSFKIHTSVLDGIIDSGLTFMTSGCPGKAMETACNRPFANCTPYQAYIGELRNYPFYPNKGDIEIIRKQLLTYSSEKVSPQPF
jgi:biotin synthase